MDFIKRNTGLLQNIVDRSFGDVLGMKRHKRPALGERMLKEMMTTARTLEHESIAYKDCDQFSGGDCLRHGAQHADEGVPLPQVASDRMRYSPEAVLLPQSFVQGRE